MDTNNQTFKYHCNNCYKNKNTSEGCFTNDIKGFIDRKECSCMEGIWNDDIKPNFKEID